MPVDIRNPNKVPAGMYLRGTEPLGCINSGVVATVRHLAVKKGKPFYDSFKALKVREVYFTGREVDVLCDTWHGYLKKFLDEIFDGRKPKQVGKVKVFYTWASAKKEFLAMNEKMIALNVKERKRVVALTKRAAKGDLKAALELSY